MKTADILRNLRLDRNMSQEEVAKALKIDRTTYAKYETGGSIKRNADKLSDFFGVSIDYLLGKTPVKHTVPPNYQPLEESPISNLVKDIFKDEPQFVDLFLTRSPEGQDTPFARKLAEISQNDKDFLKRAILMVLEKNGYDADTEAK